MTQHDLPPEPPVGAPVTPQPGKPAPNTVGRIALAAAVGGFIFACIPGALIVGWILLPVAFILGIVALTRSGQRKGTGIAAIIVSVVGTIVAVMVFLAVAVDAVDDAFDEAAGGETVATSPEPSTATSAPAESVTNDDEEPAAPAGPDGSRDHPYPFDSVVANDDWSLTFTDVDTDADDEVAQASDINDAPGEGYRWITVDTAVTYTGADAGNVLEVSVDYVTADGTVIGAHDEFVVGIEPEFDSFAELYEGGTEDGRLVFLVPDSLDGKLRVTLGLFADEVFLALPASQ